MVVSQRKLADGIMNDHDPHFHGHFLDELMFFLDMTLTFNMASNPQTDGMAEVTNHTME